MSLESSFVVVLVAEAGAGKTTRVPIALTHKEQRVWVVEPRRLAARMAARRVAQEAKVPLGKEKVGYVVRHDRNPLHYGVQFERVCPAR